MQEGTQRGECRQGACIAYHGFVQKVSERQEYAEIKQQNVSKKEDENV